MSFVQQLGRVTSSARDNFVHETLQHLMAKCEEDAAQGRRESTLELAQPSYFHEQKAALQKKLDAMGFDTCRIYDQVHGLAAGKFEIFVVWKVESPAPEDVPWQKQSPMCRQGVTRAQKALQW